MTTQIEKDYALYLRNLSALSGDSLRVREAIAAHLASQGARVEDVSERAIETLAYYFAD